MRASPPFCVAVALVAATAVASAETPRIVSRVVPGTSTVVVAAEGELEPRSVGSYSVRIYAGTDPRFPYDDFVAGIVRPRNGVVDDVLFADFHHDGTVEVVVVVRSVGTGGYRSADAFRLRDGSLSLVESVSGLARNADPIRALEAKLAERAEPRAAPDGTKSRQ